MSAGSACSGFPRHYSERLFCQADSVEGSKEGTRKLGCSDPDLMSSLVGYHKQEIKQNSFLIIHGRVLYYSRQVGSL